MRMLTFSVLFSVTVITFIVSQQFIKSSGVIYRKYGLSIFWLAFVLSIFDYVLIIETIVSSKPLFNLGFLFFIKHFWFIILCIIFLKHTLLQEKNFWYYLSIPVIFAVLLVTFFEVVILLKPSSNEYLVKDFVGWASYFGIFGGIGSGLLLGCFKTAKNIHFSIKNIFKWIFSYFFLVGVCSLFPAFTISFFIPPEAIFLSCIIPIFVYIISVIVFGEVIDFVRFIEKTKETHKEVQ